MLKLFITETGLPFRPLVSTLALKTFLTLFLRLKKSLHVLRHVLKSQERLFTFFMPCYGMHMRMRDFDVIMTSQRASFSLGLFRYTSSSISRLLVGILHFARAKVWPSPFFPFSRFSVQNHTYLLFVGRCWHVDSLESNQRNVLRPVVDIKLFNIFPFSCGGIKTSFSGSR